jgi:hypothetical protein
LFLLAGVVAAVALILWGIQFYRHRFVRQNSDVVRLLPPEDLTLVYADLGLLRQAQLVGLLANIKVAPDKEYADFIRDTGFDYTRDLDAIVIGTDSSQTFLVGRGRFDWAKLHMFALSHGGTCQDDACRIPATTAGRWVNLITVQPDVLAVAISSNQTAADNLRPPGRRVQEEIPSAPVWAKLSHAMLANPAALPLAARIFAIDLQSAASVTIAAVPDKLEVHASFANGAAADTARRQLEIQTRLLTVALKQSGEKADSGSIGGLLAGGRFQVAGNEVSGSWPIGAELLRSLE